MSKNYMQPGNALELTAPTGGVVSGVGYAFGPAATKILAVCSVSAAQTVKTTFNTEGVYELTKDGADDFVEGEPVFWDDTAKKIDKSASTLVPCGTCIETTAASATTIQVKLSGKTETVVP